MRARLWEDRPACQLRPWPRPCTQASCLLSPQPVPHSGSSGYGSLGSNGSHEHLMSQTSSSDSNGHEDARRSRAVGAPPPGPARGAHGSRGLLSTARPGVQALAVSAPSGSPLNRSRADFI